MESISPLMARIFDDPHASHRRHENHSKRSRLESKGRMSRSKRRAVELGPRAGFDGPIPLDIDRDSIRSYGAHSFAQ